MDNIDLDKIRARLRIVNGEGWYAEDVPALLAEVSAWKATVEAYESGEGHRAIVDERDRLRAENERLREVANSLYRELDEVGQRSADRMVENHQLAEERDRAEAEVERLREALDGVSKTAERMTSYARKAEAEVERLRGRLGLVRPDPKYRDPKTLADALVALGATQNALVDACAAKYEAQAHAQRAETRAEKVEAQVQAVRALAKRWRNVRAEDRDCIWDNAADLLLDEVEAALDTGSDD